MNRKNETLGAGQQDQAATETSTPKPHKYSNSRRSVLGMGLGGLLVVGCCAFIALGAGGGGDDAPTTVASAAPAAVAGQPADGTPADEVVPVAEPEPTPEPVVEEEPEPTPEPVVEEEPEPTPEPTVVIVGPASPPGAPDVHSILSDGKLFMRGTVPSAEIERQIVTAVEAILGKGNAISEYVIDESAVLIVGQSSPVYLNDTIQFEPGSAEIAPSFYPLIGITPVLLSIQPDVVVTISGHTDSVGSDSANLALSQARVDAVRDWVISQGGDPDRLIAIGYGESVPIADNASAEGRQLNRRVEFQLDGFDFTADS